MYHFFTKPENILPERIVLSGDDYNHIKNVLRMKAGEELLISDGEGTDYTCTLESLEKEAVCKIKGRNVSSNEPCAKIYLFQGLPKADKFEFIIQKAVELGTYEIIPVQTERSIVKYDAKKQKAKNERWNKISESAAKQSHRGIIPEVKVAMKFDEALEYAKSLDIILIPYENFKDVQKTKEIIENLEAGTSIGIFIGPEGGFEEIEIEKAKNAGAKPISLGNRILRTETAPLMILSVIMFELE